MMKKKLNSNNNCLLLIISLVVVFFLFLQTCQVKSYENFINDNNNTENNTNTEITEEDKETKIKYLIDKLETVNQKLHKFDDSKPMRPTVYSRLFNKQFPNFMKKERGNQQFHLFDISQMAQDSKIDNLDNETNQIITKYTQKYGWSTDPPLKSIKSHVTGNNLNIIHVKDSLYMIPVNQGCLFAINEKTGDVDYGITEPTRNDKNRFCLSNNVQQQFVLVKINNETEYQKQITSDYLDAPLDAKNVEYPFYLVKPVVAPHLSLVSDADGVHLTYTNYETNQRWGGFTFERPCHCH